MRLLAVAPLLFLAACTAFDGVSLPEAEAAGGSIGSSPSATDPASASSPGERTGGGADGAGNDASEANANPSAPSCARKHGGSTCGPNGNADCCALAKQGGVQLNKYLITAGRMRAFIEKTNGNVAGFVKGLPAQRWKPEWTSDVLPTDRASADVALGPAGKKACEQGANTGHTYWTPATPEDFSDYDRDTLDDKALNCVPWPLAQALCAFDGGHLATERDLRAAFTNDGQTKYPWGDDAPSWNAPDPKARLNLEFGFVTETMPAKFRGGDGHPSEVSFFIAPPGRFPAGDNRSGIADAAGNLLEWVGDGPRQFVWKGDFESHAADAVALNGLNGKAIWMDQETVPPGIVTSRPWTWGNGQLAGNAGNDAQKDGYYSIGARCAF